MREYPSGLAEIVTRLLEAIGRGTVYGECELRVEGGKVEGDVCEFEADIILGDCARLLALRENSEERSREGRNTWPACIKPKSRIPGELNPDLHVMSSQSNKLTWTESNRADVHQPGTCPQAI